MRADASETAVRQLFLDDLSIEEKSGLTRRWHAATKSPANPILRPTDREKSCQVYGTVIHVPEQNRYQLWYLARPWPVTPEDKGFVIGGRLRPATATYVCYAESRDGIHWERPTLGLVSFPQNPDNNIVNLGRENPEGPGIWYAPNDPDPQCRYRAFFWEHSVPVEGKSAPPGENPDGMWIAFSPDGIHWTNYAHNPVLPVGSDTGQQLVWDARLRKWVAFGRLSVGQVARTESADFLHWSQPQSVFAADSDDGPGSRFYGMGIGLYEDLYIGTAWVWRVEGDGTMDARLAFSRDGVHWQRPPKEQRAFLPNGPSGSWDAGIIYTACGLVTLEDRVRIYYCGCPGRHPSPHVARGPEATYRYSIGIVEVRRDGFASLDAGAAEGHLLTRPFVLPEGTLHLNADAGGGQVAAALCDATGRPLPGFERSQMITGDHLKSAVHWNHADLSARRGETVRLRIAAKQASLYSFWFE